jgi:peptide/nickel transport system permease protein
VLRYITSKLGRAALVLLLVSSATALLLDLAPGDPAYAYLGVDASPEAVRAVHQDLGLDRPVHERYLEWLGNAVTGDLGESYRPSAAARESVTSQVTEALPVTIELIVLSLALALAVSIPLGIYGAYRKDGALDRITTVAYSVLMSMPAYVLAPVLVFVLALQLRLLPATRWVPLTADPGDNLRHALLPALVLALELVPGFAVLLRNDMVRTLEEDFILNARSKGLSPRRVLLHHALRPSSLSLLTLSGITLGRLIGGAVIVESLFSLPGIGTLLLTSVQARDINTVQGVVLFVAAAYVLINAVVDLAYTYLDPRIRLRARA